MNEVFNPVFPLEDRLLEKVKQNPNDGFWRVKDVNGSYVKAPFDMEVIKTNREPEQDGSFPTYNPLSEYYGVVFPSYNVVYESTDGRYKFSISGILPNDKSLNIGRKFSAGENIGRILNKDSGVAFKYYSKTVVNPDAPRREQEVTFKTINEEDTQQQLTTSEQDEKESKKAGKGTLFLAGVFVLTALYIVRKFK
jgi:hypothetical protein